VSPLIKYIGIGLAALGLLLLIINLIKGKRSGIDDDRKELKMITEAGYGTQHVVAERKKAAFEGQTPIKKPKKRRALSKEAQDILDMVEKDKEEAARKAHEEKKRKSKNEFPPKPKSKGTDLLDKDRASEKGTEVLQESRSKEGTDVLKKGSTKKGTDILKKPKADTDALAIKDAPSKEGTDVLSRGDAPKEKSRAGTDVLDRSPASAKKGTDVLTKPKKSGTAVLEKDRKMKRGTDVLNEPPKQKAGTDILTGDSRTEDHGSKGSVAVEPQKKTGTDVLEKKKGTGVLPKKGTDVLERRK
jgi:hypothetical protein